MTDQTIRCFIGLGSNLDDPIGHVQRALEELATLESCQFQSHSSLYRSDPVGPAGQPDYINAVAELFTHLPPESLLDKLQAIEQAHRRVRKERWGPRTLDLDLLLYGEHLIETERLNVPHLWMKERNFVLWPLAEIAPELTLPDGTTLSECLAFCPIGTLQRLSL